MIFGKKTQKLDDFELELDRYFLESTKYRTSLRRGSIILVIDDDYDLTENMVKMLTEKEQLSSFQVCHVTGTKDAKKIIEEKGEKNFRAVITESKLASANGIIDWINQKQIPVFISDCPKEKEDFFHKKSRRAHVFIEGKTTIADYAIALGLDKR